MSNKMSATWKNPYEFSTVIPCRASLMVHLPLIRIPGLHVQALPPALPSGCSRSSYPQEQNAGNSEFFRRFQSAKNNPFIRGCLQSEGARRMIAVPRLITYADALSLRLTSCRLFRIQVPAVPQKIGSQHALLPPVRSHMPRIS